MLLVDQIKAETSAKAKQKKFNPSVIDIAAIIIPVTARIF